MSDNTFHAESNSELIFLLESLATNQRKDLKAFARLPSNPVLKLEEDILIQLIDLVQKGACKNEDQLWSEVLSPDQIGNLARIKSRILKTIRRYISFSRLDGSPLLQKVLTAQYYDDHAPQKEARKIIKKGINALEKEQSPTNQVYLVWFYEMLINSNKENKKRDPHLDDSENALEEFYHWNRMRMICEKINRNIIINREINKDEYAGEVNSIFEKSISNHVRAYVQLFWLLTDGEKVHLESLEKYLEDYTNQLAKGHRIEIYTHLMNYCIRGSNNGQISLLNKYLQYVDQLLDEGLILENGKIKSSQFQNYIISCISLDDADRAFDFMDKFGSKISSFSSANRKSFLEYIKAIIHMHKNDLEHCHLSLLEYEQSKLYKEDIYRRINADKLRLKYYLLLKEYQAAYRKMRSIKNFLRVTTSLPKGRKKAHSNFFKHLTRYMENKRLDPQIMQSDLLASDFNWFVKNKIGGVTKP